MSKIITIRVNDKFEFEDEQYSLKDFIISIPKLGLIRADVVLQEYLQMQRLPNKIDLQYKIDKYKKFD